VKLAIRTDEKAGLVRAYFNSLDDSRRDEVATISLQLLRKVPGLFEVWNQALADALAFALKECGYEVVGFDRVRPHDKN
jgi:hypothetical protein